MANCPWCNAILPDQTTSRDFCPACYTALSSTIPREPYNVPKPKTPVTTALILINLAVFCAMLIAGHSMSVSGEQPLHWGADWGPLTLHFQWWRVLTSTFVHFSKCHIVDNLLLLWILGRRAERVFGKWQFLALYVITGVAASIVTLAVIPETVSCGASGGIFGLFGALLIAWYFGRFSLSLGAKWGLGIVALLMGCSLYAGFTDPEVANSAHVAGFVSGLILGELLVSWRMNSAQFRRWVFRGAAALLLLGMISLHYVYGYLAPLASVEQEISEKRYKEASAHINMVLQHNPDSGLANTEAADCYFEEQDYAKAEAAASKSIEIDPDNLSGTLILARVYLRTHRVDKARALAMRLLLEKKADDERRTAAVLIMAAITEEEKSEPGKH